MTNISEDDLKKYDAQDILLPINQFQRFFNYIFPITRSEAPKFLMITLLMFCILGIQNLMRAMKDSIINTLIGTETISFLKFWGVLPSAFMITILYVKLVSVMKGENIFYLIMSVFLSFFLLFAFVLFPNEDIFHLNVNTMNRLVSEYPNFKWFILLCSKWSFSLFYIIAELWPNVMFALLFWQFVNNITTVSQSKKYYPLFGLLGQTGLYASGSFLSGLPQIDKFLIRTFNLSLCENILSIQVVISVAAVLGVIALITFWILNHKIICKEDTQNLQFKAKTKQIGVKESLKMIISSRYIRLITILLFSYGLAINLIEGPWKATATKIYTTPPEFAAFVGTYLSYTGILTIIFVLVASIITRRFGWVNAAIITPFMVLITGFAFFCISNFDPIATFMMLTFSFTDPMMLTIIIGAIQNVLSKSCKYTLFDSTKEMAYVPLDVQLKTRGKAAADMIGVKLGKSTSAFIQSVVFIIFPSATYSSLSPLLMLIFIAISFIWIWAVIELNKEYKFVCKTECKN